MDFYFELNPKYFKILVNNDLTQYISLQIKIIEHSTDNLLELLDDKSPSEKLYILSQSMCDISRFKILHENLVNEINNHEYIYHLFVFAVKNCYHEIVQYLLENNYNTTEYLDLILKIIVDDQRANESNIILLKTIIAYGVDVTKNNNYAICAVSNLHSQNLTMFKLLQDNGADISARSNYPIRKAAEIGELDLVWHLIRSGADFRTLNDYVLRKCCTNNNIDLVNFLLENGADIKNFIAEDIIFLINFCTVETLDLLFKYNLDLANRSLFKFQNTPNKNKIMEKYIFFVEKCGMEPLDFILTIRNQLMCITGFGPSHKTNFNFENNEGFFVQKNLENKIKECPIDDLLDYVRENKYKHIDIFVHSMYDFEKFKLLYQNFINKIDFTTNYKLLFSYSVSSGYHRVVQYLIENNNTPECLDFILKIIVNSKSVSESNIIMLKLIIEHGVDVTSNNNYAICAVAHLQDPALTVFKLLKESGADISARSNCPIKEAAEIGNIELLWYLIQSGVDFRTSNDYVLRRCCRYDNFELIKFLLENGADVKNFTTEDIVTLVESCTPETIKLLLSYGLDLTIRSSSTFQNTLTQNELIDKYNFFIDKCGMDPKDFILSVCGSDL